MTCHRLTVAALAAGLVLVCAPGFAQEEEPVIEDGKTISIEYTLKLEDGSVADSNVGGEPLVYVQGESQILPALEAELAGMKAEEIREVTLEPDQGYGPVRQDAIQPVPLDKIPEGARHVGAQLMGQDPNGNPIYAKVTEVNEDESQATLDFNHPLAGETLHFEVKVVSIQ